MTNIGDAVTVRGERYRVFDVEHSQRFGSLRLFYLRHIDNGTDWQASGKRVQHNSHLTATPEHVVEIVAYGNAVHAYAPGDESAEVVYMTAIAANADAIRAKLSPWVWRAMRNALADDIEIHDHRN